MIDCDKLAREVVQPGKPAYHKVVRLFGKSAVQSNGKLLRKKIAKIIFHEPRKRKQLEKIIHPEVIRQMKKRISSIKSGLVVAEIPLLFEAKLTKIVDKIVVVWLPLKKQIQRLRQRNGVSKKDALIRIRSQLSLNRKRTLADAIIDNSGPPTQTKKRIKELYEKFLAKGKSPR